MSACIQGRAAATGLALGQALHWAAAVLQADEGIAAAQVPAEQGRFSQACQAAAAELEAERHALPAGSPPALAELLDLHHMLLQDPDMLATVHALIAAEYLSAEAALQQQSQSWAAAFAAADDAYLQERQADMQQLSQRLLRQLQGGDALGPLLAQVQAQPTVLLADDVLPSDVWRLQQAGLQGLATAQGGPTGHTALVARSLQLPCVVGLGTALVQVPQGSPAALDGEAGQLHHGLSTAEQAAWQTRLRAQETADMQRESLRSLPCQTPTGERVFLYANIERSADAAAAHAAGADGVGLFRSEYLFMGRPSLPTEDEQYAAYAQALQGMAGRPVTIRTLDAGADKPLQALPLPPEANPALGLRGIRLSLAQPAIFKTQLRALLRAAQHGPLAIMFPMVSSMAEVEAALALLGQCRAELTQSGQAHGPLQVGAMVEVPAAAFIATELLQRLDFLSIGSNDLIQYTLAADRGHPALGSLYQPQHPAVLALIEMTLAAGRKAGKPVSLCGDMAADPECTHRLLGLGLRHFSMPVGELLRVKERVLGWGDA